MKPNPLPLPLPLPLPHLPCRERLVIFSRQLPKTAIEKEINVKGGLLRAREENIIKIKYKNRVYDVDFKSRSSGYKKTVLYKGWLQLVRTNNLEVGDLVTLLEPEDDQQDCDYVMEVTKMIDLNSVESAVAEILLDLNSAPSLAQAEVLLKDSSLVSAAETLLEMRYGTMEHPAVGNTW